MQEDVRSAVPRTATRKKMICESQEEDVRKEVVDLFTARKPISGCKQSRKTLPKNLIARTPEQMSCKASGSGGLLS